MYFGMLSVGHWSVSVSQTKQFFICYPQDVLTCTLFAWFISRTFSANEHYFSLTTNRPTVFSAMAYQPSEHGTYYLALILHVKIRLPSAACST